MCKEYFEGDVIRFISKSDKRFSTVTVGEVSDLRYDEVFDEKGNSLGYQDFYEVQVERDDLFCGVGYLNVYLDEIL